MIWGSKFANNAIVCSGKKTVDLDALNLLASGTIAEFCSCSYKNDGKHHHFVYSTESMIALSQCTTEIVFSDVVEMLRVVRKILGVIAKSSLNADNLQIADDCIFKDGKSYRFIYLPLSHKTNMDASDCILKLLSVIRYKSDDISGFVDELRKKKTDEEALTWLDFFLQKQCVHSYSSQTCFAEEATSLLSQPEYDKEATSLLNQLRYDEGATSLLNQFECDEGETSLLNQSNEVETTFVAHGESTEVLVPEYSESCLVDFSSYDFSGGADETTVLTAYGSTEFVPRNEKITGDKILYLMRSLNGERIMVDITPFKLGKDSVNMDFVLNNDSVSRHHATIVYEDSAYFITDNNSTNGTVVEGLRIQPQEKEEIDSGYIISLGNESFQAYLERR